MSHAKETNRVKDFFYKLYLSYIPNGRDNIKQIIIKVFFLISLTTLIVSASYLTNYFLSAKKQENIIEDTRSVWHETSETEPTAEVPSAIELLLQENSDFKGWITIPNTKIDNPIYQTTDNSYYLTHNQKRQKSAYGALFFDCDNKITETETDKNLVIYGHHMKNGSMFANLTKYKSLSFYKQNPTIEFSTLYKKSTYKIYSVFVLNASKEDDNGYIYNISRKSFLNDADFDAWADEAYERSLINTGVDVKNGDNIITLVTCVYDFDDARLVVMARETREDEEPTVNTSTAVANPSPRYPKRWYDDRGIDFPFD
ncbi:MAG: class B sortase [Acutalibacteraceae bacterium]